MEETFEDTFADFALYFGGLPDPRSNNGRLRHELTDILAMALCAMLSGAESFVEMEEYGQSKEAWLRERLGLHLAHLAHGIPSHDTFARLFARLLFARLDPAAFEACLVAWTQSLHTLHTLTRGQVIAVDGKTCAVPSTRPLVRVHCTWSVPGPERVAWCWARKRWTRKAMR